MSLDEFDALMSSLFKKSTPAMWWTILLSLIILLNLL